MATGRIHVDERCLDKLVATEPREDSLGMDLFSRMEMGWGIEGLKEEREGVEIGLNSM